ncbi:sugar ABC transporter permease, partial [Candidatus Babeliales bacterium]|nr:sugar ABC transporter permease [Candidatus Babeliales bacterium]
MSSLTSMTQAQNKNVVGKKSKKTSSIRRREQIAAYIFLFPALFSIVTFVLLPISFAFIMSLFKNPTTVQLSDFLVEYYTSSSNLDRISFYEFFTLDTTTIFADYGIWIFTLAVLFLVYIKWGYKVLKKKTELKSPAIALIALLTGLAASPLMIALFKMLWIYIPLVLPIRNYFDVLTLDSLDFLRIFFNTVFWTVTCVFFHVVLGIFLAVLINRDFAGKGFFRGVFIIPWAIPSFASTIIWKNFVFDEAGVFGRATTDRVLFPNGDFYFNFGNLIAIIFCIVIIVLIVFLAIKFIEKPLLKNKSYSPLFRTVFLLVGVWVAWMFYESLAATLGGTTNNFLSYNIVAIENTTGKSFWFNTKFQIFGEDFVMITFSAILVNIWLGVPFMMVSFLAAMQGIPTDLYEAAEIDGANAWTQFKSITFQLIKPTLFTVSLLGFIWTFNLFNVVYILAQGVNIPSATDYQIFVTYIYNLFSGPGTRNYSQAAALSFIVFLLLTVF